METVCGYEWLWERGMMNICNISSYFHVYMVLVLELSLFHLLDFLLYLNIICTPAWFLLESF